MHSEISSLKLALQHSPNNLELKKIIHSKMMGDWNYYRHELFELSKDIHAQDKDYILAVESLVSYYFEEKKFSTAELILDQYGNYDLFSEECLLVIAKIFVEVGRTSDARECYEFAVNKFPNASDEVLDRMFRSAQNQTEDSDENSLFLETPKESFKDVGGMENVKREINLKIILPLKNPELYEQYGKKAGGGILLYGPPGCGKTFIAKATAGEIDANFISLGLHDILDMWIGNSEKNLHNIFEVARAKQPSVIFIDEIDALGMKRSNLSTSAGRNIVNQFLTELDGINSNNEGLLIIGATNAPWDIDGALRRPGRFDRIIFIPPPDQSSREAILRIKLNDKPTESIDFALISRKTVDFSGADIDAIINLAVEDLLERALESGKMLPITTDGLLRAIRRHRPSTIDWFNTVKNYTVFANKSGLYDDVVTYLKKK